MSNENTGEYRAPRYKQIINIATVIVVIVGIFLYRGCTAKSELKYTINGVSFELADMNGATGLTEKMLSALDDGYENITKHATGTREWSIPDPVRHSWVITSKTHGEPVRYIFVIENNADTERYVTETTESFADVYNLKTGTEYYWSVTAVFDDGTEETSKLTKYTTSDRAPRVLNIDGVTNCRDLGGWKTTSGKRVKQGMIIRTARFNENGKEDITITDEGKETLLKTLGIKTEIDLRLNEIRTESALGSDVRYVNIGLPGTVVSQLRLHDDTLRQIISEFAKEENYPINVHCSIGTDRTGLVCFLINGLLGVPEDSLYMDYVFSNFGHISSMRKITEVTEGYLTEINTFPGDTLQERIENYLLEIGVTKEETETIRNIMIEQ